MSWQRLVDLQRLADWLRTEGVANGPVEGAKLLTGGTQNILVQFCCEGREYVLRRPPARPRADGNRAIQREARILRALAGTGVPHPKLLAECTDPEVLGASFFLMEAVRGFNATAGVPAGIDTTPTAQHQRGIALVDGAVAMAQVDVVAADLAVPQRRFAAAGEPERWRKYLEGYSEFVGWRGPGELPHLVGVQAWLERNAPSHTRMGLVHGDYHLGNVMYGFDAPGLAAIIDWELASVGDPLLDLGWVLATWPDSSGESPVGLTVRPWHGFPAGEDLVTRYLAGTGRDEALVEWFAVFACYKLAILLEGTWARACAGVADSATGQRLHASAIRLLERGKAWTRGT